MGIACSTETGVAWRDCVCDADSVVRDELIGVCVEGLGWRIGVTETAWRVSAGTSIRVVAYAMSRCERKGNEQNLENICMSG